METSNPQPTPAPKPGLKTTEFWTAILGAASGIIAAVLTGTAGHPWTASICAVAAVILPAVYIWGRAVLKSEAEKRTNIIPDAWEPPIAMVLSFAESLADAVAVAILKAQQAAAVTAADDEDPGAERPGD